MLLRWRNVEASCHKHFVVVSCHQQTLPLTSDKWHNLPRSVAAKCIALGGGTVHSTQCSQILADNRDLYLPHLHSTPSLGGLRRKIAITFGVEKTRMLWLPDGEKNLKIRYDGRADGRTDWHTDTAWRHRPRLHGIARQKSWRTSYARCRGRTCASLYVDIATSCRDGTRRAVILPRIRQSAADCHMVWPRRTRDITGRYTVRGKGFGVNAAVFRQLIVKISHSITVMLSLIFTINWQKTAAWTYTFVLALLFSRPYRKG